MKKIFATPEIFELLAAQGVETVCTPNMDVLINNDDTAKVADIVTRCAPAATGDYSIDNVETWEEMAIDEKSRQVRVLNDTYNFTECENGETAAYNVKSGYENNPDWFGFEVLDVERFENNLRDIINDMYFNE